MKILIDTNVLIDVFTKRDPYCAASADVLRLTEKRGMTLFVTVSQTTDIFYILHRYLKDSEKAREYVKFVGDNMTLADTTVADYNGAIASDITDFEDALLAFCAKRLRADWIITRNETDFKLSPVPAVSPENFLKKHFPPDVIM
jgi:predicted nucleic acid-binding protein